MRNDIVVYDGRGSVLKGAGLGGIFPNRDAVVVDGDVAVRIETHRRRSVGRFGDSVLRARRRAGIEIGKRKLVRHIDFDGRVFVSGKRGRRFVLIAKPVNARLDPPFGGRGSTAQSFKIVLCFGFDGVDVSLRLREPVIRQDESPPRENMSQRHVR